MLKFHTEICRTASAAATLLLSVLAAGYGHAQAPEDTAVRTRITVTQADINAAAGVTFSSHHVMAAGIPGAKQKAAALNAENARRVAEYESRRPGADSARPEGTLAKPYFYPADLVKGSAKALTLAAAVNHAVYIGYKGTIAANWGNPEGYLTNLYKSTFIHLADQYTGSTTDNYTVGTNASPAYSFYGNVLYEHELWAIVHSVAATSGYGAGTGKIYHLFLPNGIDTCFDETAECYSPDNFDTWVFCAYHDYVQFKDIGTVLFTVEPYQNVDGCAVHPLSPSGNSVLVDSTDSVLTHETFETITDPEPDSGWTNQTSLDLEEYESADECQPLTDDNGNFLVPTFLINGKKYGVQLIYSNTYHACAAQP